MGYHKSGSEATILTHEFQSLFPSICKENYQPFLPYTLQSTRPDNLLEAVTTTLQVSVANEVVFFHPGADSPETAPLRYVDGKMKDTNLCIMPLDGSWLLYHAENKSWQWGKRHQNAHLFDPEKKRFFIHWGSGGFSALKNLFISAAAEMGSYFDPEDFRASEAKFRESGTDSYIYIIKGQDVWIEVTMKREEGYYTWQCLTQEKELVESWRSWFSVFR